MKFNDALNFERNLRGGMTVIPACPAKKGWVPHCPDFLRRLVALIHFMRLSLMKGAHAHLSSAAWQETGVKPRFGLSGTPQHSTLLFVFPPHRSGLDNGAMGHSASVAGGRDA